MGAVRFMIDLSKAACLSAVMLLLLDRARALLRPVGTELARRGALAAPEDLFFLTLEELSAGIAGKDFRAIVSDRRRSYDRELHRHAPAVLLSDGTEPQGDGHSRVPAGAVLSGIPVSAGSTTGRARKSSS